MNRKIVFRCLIVMGVASVVNPLEPVWAGALEEFVVSPAWAEMNNIDGDENAELANLDVRRFTARQQAMALQRRFGSLNRLALPGAPGEEGRVQATPTAAQSATAQGWTIWSDNSFSRLKDKRPSTASKGPSLSFTAGLDRLIGNSLTVGANVNLLYSDLDTFYFVGTKRTTAYAASLYLHYQLSDWLALEMQGGYVHQKQKLRFSVAGLGSARASRRANGYMLTATLNASRWFDNVLLSSRAGIIATRDRWSSLRAIDTATGALAFALPAQTEKLVQGVVEAGVSVWLDPVMPHFSVTYTHDLARKGPGVFGDRDDFTLTGGLAWYPPGELDGFTLDVSGSVVVGRRAQRNYTAAIGMKWSW